MNTRVLSLPGRLSNIPSAMHPLRFTTKSIQPSSLPLTITFFRYGDELRHVDEDRVGRLRQQPPSLWQGPIEQGSRRKVACVETLRIIRDAADTESSKPAVGLLWRRRKNKLNFRAPHPHHFNTLIHQ